MKKESTSKNKYIVVITTIDSKKKAEELSQKLVENRLVACAQIIGPITSIYWWQDKVEKAKEWVCLMKSKKSLFSDIEKMILSLHPYQVPEIITLPLLEGTRSYLAWLEQELKKNK